MQKKRNAVQLRENGPRRFPRFDPLERLRLVAIRNRRSSGSSLFVSRAYPRSNRQGAATGSPWSVVRSLVLVRFGFQPLSSGSRLRDSKVRPDKRNPPRNPRGVEEISAPARDVPRRDVYFLARALCPPTSSSTSLALRVRSYRTISSSPCHVRVSSEFARPNSPPRSGASRDANLGEPRARPLNVIPRRSLVPRRRALQSVPSRPTLRRITLRSQGSRLRVDNAKVRPRFLARGTWSLEIRETRGDFPSSLDVRLVSRVSGALFFTLPHRSSVILLTQSCPLRTNLSLSGT